MFIILNSCLCVFFSSIEIKDVELILCNNFFVSYFLNGFIFLVNFYENLEICEDIYNCLLWSLWINGKKLLGKWICVIGNEVLKKYDLILIERKWWFLIDIL